MNRSHPLDVRLQLATTGEDVTIRDLLGGQPALIVLTRHMDCPYCEVYVGKVIQAHHDLGRVIVVGHGTPDELAAHHAGLPHEFVVLADPGQRLYRAFEARRLTSWFRMRVKLLNTSILLRHLLRGGKLVRAGQDPFQLGADVIVDPDGTVRWLHLSEQVDDRPTVRELRTHLHRAA